MKFAIVGDPVEHSRSPDIHNAALEEMGIGAEYERMHIAAGEFDRVVEMLRSGQLDGVNVTMPHKLAAFNAVDIHSDNAALTGAVNTITVDREHLIGDNTDVDGVLYARHRVAADGTGSTLVLGTGGAAAAAVVAGRDSSVFVSGRRPSGVASLIERTGVHVHAVPWGEGVAGSIVVNATPIGMAGEDLPAGIIEVASAFIDMTYGPGTTPALERARRVSVPAVGGEEMLLGQALVAFARFTGRPAPETTMRDALAGTLRRADADTD